MSETSRNDIRRLLKTFGIQADEAIMAHLESTPGNTPLMLRITLEDQTDSGDAHPGQKLHLEIDGQISR